MNFIDTELQGLYLIELNILKDDRGLFARTYCKNEFASIGFAKEFVQMNHSINNKRGTLRGMHFQLPPVQETKLIRCVVGKVFDVAIDLRKGSETYLKWFGAELSKDNMKMIFIPEGFAHGFITLEDNTELIYCHTEFYNPAFESGIRHDDSTINIQWPIEAVIISEKDKNYSLIKLN